MLEKLNGVDVADVLGRLDGNQVLLWELFEEFLRTFSPVIRDIREAAGEGRTKEALLLAHKLKGSAANLSMREVYSITEDLETAMKKGFQDKTGPLLSLLEAALNRVFESIRQGASETGSS